MTFDLQGILESKRALRRNLANRPIAEKLAMLELLRDRARTIREAAMRVQSGSPPLPPASAAIDAACDVIRRSRSG